VSELNDLNLNQRMPLCHVCHVMSWLNVARHNEAIVLSRPWIALPLPGILLSNTLVKSLD